MTTESNPILKRAVRLALLAGSAAAVAVHPAAVRAQTASGSTAENTGELNEVVVTGSRIASPSLDAISPVTAVSSEEFKETGVTRVEDLLNSLPQVTADQGSGLSMTANGTATVNLRGLGVQRTLVLVNGRRLQGGDPGAIQGATPAYASAADLNQIPVALIERVDVLTGGASSTYGADAVAGVVNFVMNDHFEGVRVDANIGIYNHSNHEGWVDPLLTAGGFAPVTGSNWDGSNKDFTIIMGHNFADGAGNFEGYLGYRTVAAITANHRDHSACTLSDGSSTGALPYSCGGSSTTAPAVFDNPGIGKFQVSPGGDLVNQFNHFNYGASHYLQRNDERYTAGFFGKLKFNDHAEAYSEFMFMDDLSTGNYAPAGSFLGSARSIDADTGLPDGALQYNCGPLGAGFGNPGMNPYITAAEYPTLCPGVAYTNSANRASATPFFPYQMGADGTGQILIGRRNIEGGPRQDEYTHTSYRGVFGVRGEIVEDWTYDAYGLFSTTRSSDFHNNDTSTQHIQNALLAVPGPGGTPVCAGGQAGCVPWPIFNPAVAVSPAALAYISVPGVFLASTQENIGSAYVSGDLTKSGIKMPWANDGLKVVFGTEYRRDTLTADPDAEYQSGDLSGIGSPAPPVAAAQHVWELFTEERLPIVRDAPFMKTFDFETGYRYSSYSEGYNTNTYKFGLEWAPINDVRVRASFNRAVRAPNLQELYQPDHVALDGSTDVCTGHSFTAAQCALLGLSGAQYAAGGAPSAPSSQYNGLVGGSPALRPEVGKTYDVGLVFTPTFLPNFSATVDYTDIKISGLVNSYGSSVIQTRCATTSLAFWCDLIHRDAGGTLWASPSGYVVDPLLNEGGLEYRGIDIGLAYKIGFGRFGDLRARLDGTWLKDLIYSPGGPGSVSYNCAARFGLSCDPITPTWRHRMTLDWDSPVAGLSGGLVWRFMGKAVNTFVDPKEPDYLPHWEDLSPLPDAEIPNYSYFDVHASYVWNKLTVRLGCNNVLDKDPPSVGQKTGGNDVYYDNNTYASVYDLAGRFIFMNVTVDF